MKAVRAGIIATLVAAGVTLGAGTAHAALTDAVLLTAPEAQSAMAYSAALTQEDLPVTVPGLLMRNFKGGGTPADAFMVLVSDPQGAGSSEDNSKNQVEKVQNQAKNTYPGLECKVYEQSGDKITVVCWGNDPAMVLGFSADVKKYTKKQKVNGKMRTVVFKSIPVLGTVTRFLGSADDEDGAASVQVTEADRVRAANEAKGLRNAQVAKLPAKYQ